MPLHSHLAAAAAAAASSPMLTSPISSPISNTAPSSTHATLHGTKTPCSTLFVANLGPFCTEQELKDIFGR